MEGQDAYSTIVHRAREEVAKEMRGEARTYSLYYKNCERFARYCATGDSHSYSHQVGLLASSWLSAILLPVVAKVAGVRLLSAALFGVVIVASVVRILSFAIDSGVLGTNTRPRVELALRVI